MKYLMELYSYTKDILKNENFLKEKNFPHHKHMTAYKHSINVAYMSLKLCKNKRVDRKKLARTALLHDYYLYNWHNKEETWHKPHGIKHGHIAMINAQKDFDNFDENAIERHMWPLTIKPPKTRIGWIVTLADKIVGVCEFLKIKVCY